MCVCVSNYFVKIITPAPEKLKLWLVYVIFSNQTGFVVCTGRQPSTDETLIVETAVWPIPFLINMFTALKRSQF